jgi:hypothetical protein
MEMNADARTVEPFHVENSIGAKRLLGGFTFRCSEKHNEKSDGRVK